MTASLHAAVAVPETPPPVVDPLDRLDDPTWKGRHEAKLREARSKPVDLLLLGDSITENYELTGPDPLHDYRGVWQRFYANRNALNLGFSGDGTQNLLWRILNGEINGLAPKVAVVLIGTNDIGWLSRTAADTVEGINAVLAARYDDVAVPYVVYRDVSPAFIANGIPDISLFADPQEIPSGPALHPTPEGQARMAAALEPTLSHLLGDARRY